MTLLPSYCSPHGHGIRRPPSPAQTQSAAHIHHPPTVFCTLRPSNHGGRHASDTNHADDGDDDGAAAQLPGVRRGRSCSSAAARRLWVRLGRRLLRGAGRGAGAHRALLCVWPGVRRAGRGTRRVLRLHQASALAEERAPAPTGAASRGDKAAGCIAATAAAGAVKRKPA
jgi:hypothetical protein